MSRSLAMPVPRDPALRRLASLALLDAPSLEALRHAMLRPRSVAARRELLTEGEEIRESLLLLDGWAARFRQLEDGRRQIISMILPGDVIGLCDQDRPVASSSIIAITPVSVCVAPPRHSFAPLDRAYAHGRAMDEAYLMAHITRLGRLNAHERMADLMLELLERLELAGLATDGRYDLPLTQESLADLLGLTSVHVNRTLQGMRRAGDIVLRGRDLTICHPARLYRQIGRVTPRVCLPQAGRSSAPMRGDDLI